MTAVAVVAWLLTSLSLAVALWLVVLIVLDRRPSDVVTYALLLIEAGLVLNLVLGVIRVTGDHQGVEVVTYVGYLIGALVILPLGWLWAVSEKTRAGAAVLLVAVLLVPFLLLRMHDIWSAHV